MVCPENARRVEVFAPSSAWVSAEWRTQLAQGRAAAGVDGWTTFAPATTSLSTKPSLPHPSPGGCLPQLWRVTVAAPRSTVTRQTVTRRPSPPGVHIASIQASIAHFSPCTNGNLREQDVTLLLVSSGSANFDSQCRVASAGLEDRSLTAQRHERSGPGRRRTLSSGELGGRHTTAVQG